MKKQCVCLSAFLLLVVLALACTHKGLGQNKTASTKVGFQKVLWIVLQHKDAEEVLKNPFFGELSHQGAVLSNMHAEAHPSQPNYISMIAADTLGVEDDRNAELSESHFVDLLEAKNRTWKAYAEGFPGNCFLGASSGRYVRKHVPFLNFKSISNSKKRCANIVNEKQFDEDLKNKNLPNYAMYIPNLDNGGQETTLNFVGNFMKKKFSALLSSPEFLKDRLIVITFDQSETLFNNQIYTVLLGERIGAGVSSTQRLNHISLIRLIEDEWNLGSLNRRDETALIPDAIWD